MTHLDDVNLGRRLRALRIDPPETGFDTRLAEQLLAAEAEVRAPAGGARVIRGPWLRRGPVRLLGTTALLVAGAAAAMEGRVVEWVQTRVFERVDAPPAAPPAEPAPRVRHERTARLERELAPLAETTTVEADPAPVPALSITPRATADAPAAEPTPRVLGLGGVAPRIEPERSARHAGRVQLGMERRTTLEPRPARGEELLRVPRVSMERRSSERPLLDERRADRQLPQSEPRDTERRLERLREVTRQRRERADERTTGERAASLLRERRERVSERRDATREREHERRERGEREERGERGER